MNDRDKTFTALLCAVPWLIPLGLILAAPVMREPNGTMSATAYFGEAPRLIGYGCEPDGRTMTAEEEDHFPRCERIERFRP